MIATRGARWRGVGAAVLIAALAVTGCGTGATENTETTSSDPAASQQAPSVWATAPTDSPAAQGASADLLSAEATLPGMSQECSDAIRAQSTVSDLIRGALGDAAQQISQQDEDATDTSFTPVLTGAQVTEAFDGISGLVPAALKTDFAALRNAAEQITETAPTDIPDVMEEAAVTEAITAITQFITECQPATADGE